MSAISFLVFFISVVAFVVYWYKKRQKRKIVGENYENDSSYKKFSKLQSWSGVICIISVYSFLYFSLSEINNLKVLPIVYCVVTFVITAIAFIVYWWKKRKARIVASEDYQNDENYRSISFRKRVIGLVCVISFIGMPLTVPEMTPEEKAAYQAREEQEKIAAEEKRLAQEKSDAEKKAQEEAEEKRLAEEKKAQEEAEQKRLAEEKAQREAEEKRLAEEKKLKKEAERKRLAEKKAQEEAEEKRLAEEKKLKKEAERKRLAEKKAQEEAEQKRLAEEKAQREAEEKRLADEKKAQEMAEVQKRKEDRRRAEEDNEPGILDRALDRVKEFVGGIANNEIYVCDKSEGSYYIIPSTKKRRDAGIIFKDEGYEIEVICKRGDLVLKSDIYWFCKRNDGTWEYTRDQDKNWHRIKHTYSEFEEKFSEDLGKLIYDKSNHFPNL